VRTGRAAKNAPAGQMAGNLQLNRVDAETVSASGSVQDHRVQEFARVPRMRQQ
jgi:hypothetical protein